MVAAVYYQISVNALVTGLDQPVMNVNLHASCTMKLCHVLKFIHCFVLQLCATLPVRMEVYVLHRESAVVLLAGLGNTVKMVIHV